MTTTLQPQLRAWSEVSTAVIIGFTLAVFPLALFGVLRPGLLFVLPCLLYSLFVILAAALYLTVGPLPNGSAAPLDELPWFGPLNWVCQWLQLLLGAACLALYLRAARQTSA